jgi:ribosomal protein L37E
MLKMKRAKSWKMRMTIGKKRKVDMLFKCEKCGGENFKVDYKSSCDNCEYNGYTLDDETLEKLGMDTSLCWETLYDEELRKRASEVLEMEVRRTEAGEEGSCKLGSGQGEGCWRFTCSECGEHKDIIPIYVC